MTNRAQTFGATGTMPPIPAVGAIERGVPIPRKRFSRSALRAQLAALQIQESFVTSHSPQSVRWFAKVLGITVTLRTEPHGARRVWRLT